DAHDPDVRGPGVQGPRLRRAAGEDGARPRARAGLPRHELLLVRRRLHRPEPGVRRPAGVRRPGRWRPQPGSCVVAITSRFGSMTISMRRFRRLLSASSFDATGWNSPKPAPDTLAGATPAWIRTRTTDRALALDSSQLDGKRSVEIGTLSVCPSTWNARSVSSESTPPISASVARPSAPTVALPDENRMSCGSWMTMRPRTMFTLTRPPSMRDWKRP